MKMPGRLFYPPVDLLPDIFGLHRPSLLGSACESEADRLKRVAAVENGVRDAFAAAVDHLGEEEARQLFRRMIRRPKRGLGKMLAPDRDARLLREYDAACQKGETTAALARRLHDEGRELRRLKRGAGAWRRAMNRLRFSQRQRPRNSPPVFTRFPSAAAWR